MKKLEIYDCTLREGEQAGGVSFSVDDRIEIAKALDEFGVDFIELGWPIDSEVLEAFLRVEKENLKTGIVAFGSTSRSDDVENDANLNSILNSRAKYACIFGKSWDEHVEKQLRITKEENLERIKKSVAFLKSRGVEVFYDAEHYFDGFKSDAEYAMKTIWAAAEAGATKIILCDTNGGTLPEEMKKILEKTSEEIKRKFPEIILGVHFHNDCGLALSNSLESLDKVSHVHGTINGLGERVGNLDLCEFVPLLMLKKNFDLELNLGKIKELSEKVYRIANLPHKIGQAFVSQRAFTHKGGVHIDATSKGASYSHVNPSDLGMDHSFILTSLGGSACVVGAAKKFGIEISKEESKEKISKILRELREKEIAGYDFGNLDAEQEILIQKHLGKFEEFFEVLNWEIFTDGKKSRAKVEIEIGGEKFFEETESANGPIDAIYSAINELLGKRYSEIKNLELKDYKVRIAKQNSVGSSVRTRIDFSDGFEFSTVGVSENIIQSGIDALVKGFNYYLNKKVI